MRGLVVKEGEYCHRRKTSCCGHKTRAGESVILIDKWVHGALKGVTIIHKRCVEELCEALPADAGDYVAQFKHIRENILSTGEAFPEIEEVRGPRGVRAVLVDDIPE